MQEGENSYHCSVKQKNCYWPQQALSVCLVLNKDFTRSECYNHRISSGGKGFCESLYPSAPRKRVSKWDQTIQDLYHLNSEWLLSLIFSAAIFHHPYCVNFLSFYLIGTSLDATCHCHPLSFCFGPEKGPVKLGRNQVWKSRWTLCISRKLSLPSHPVFK